MPKDYYDILGVGKGASDDDIKRAFRRLAHQHHPDKSGGDDAKFKEINQAYQTLGDADKRKKYDQFGEGYEQMGGHPGHGGFDFNGAGANFDFSGIGDMFGDIFGASQGGGRRGPAQGRNIQMDVTLDFKEAAFGAAKSFEVYKTMNCDTCGGNGAEKGSKLVDCIGCGGSGQVRKVQQTILGSFQTVAVCSRCNGQGKLPEKSCKKCGGAGVAKGTREISINIPAGIADGEVLRVSGEGEAMPHGGRAGDLFLAVRVRPDKRFARDGFDVRSIAEVPFSRAALGGEVSIETIDGPVELKIPAGTQPGAEFRLRARGIPHLKRSGRGDHIVEVTIAVPKKLTREQKRVLETWDEL